MKRIKRFAFLKNIFFPPRCASCSELINPMLSSPRELTLCKRCLDLWNREKSEICDECGYEARLCTCTTERLSKAGVEKLTKLTFYRPKRAELTSSKLIYRLKNQNNRVYFDFLGQELRGRISFELGLIGALEDDIIFTYAPRRRGAVVEFGHDQARLLALSCAEALELDSRVHCKDLIKRVLGGEQKRLGRLEREENMREAFCLAKGADLKGKTVIIFDDVVTSGATLARCAELACEAGADKVLCVCIAKSQKNL